MPQSALPMHGGAIGTQRGSHVVALVCTGLQVCPGPHSIGSQALAASTHGSSGTQAPQQYG